VDLSYNKLYNKSKVLQQVRNIIEVMEFALYTGQAQVACQNSSLDPRLQVVHADAASKVTTIWRVINKIIINNINN